MKMTTRVLLLISLTAGTIGLTTNVLWGIGLPVGAIFFGLFLIFKVLEKEVALFDEEHGRRLEIAARFEQAVSPSKAAELGRDHDLASSHAGA